VAVAVAAPAPQPLIAVGGAGELPAVA